MFLPINSLDPFDGALAVYALRLHSYSVYPSCSKIILNTRHDLTQSRDVNVCEVCERQMKGLTYINPSYRNIFMCELSEYMLFCTGVCALS